MIWLMLSILLSAYLGLTFTIFNKFGISTLQAIVINYIICGVTGIVYLHYNSGTVTWVDTFSMLSAGINKPYFKWAIVQGIGFFAVFKAISDCSISMGVATTQISNKLSLVIPTVLSVFLFGDQFSVLKIIGLIVAIGAVYLGVKKMAMLLALVKAIFYYLFLYL